MARDDSVHDCKTDTRAWELILAMQALKHAEELMRELHIEPRAVITHRIHDLIPLLARGHLN
jgi:hypothetical protein